MEDAIDEVLKRFNRNDGAPEALIAENIDALGGSLPWEYSTFLQYCNGGEGYIGDTYLILWKVEELIDFNAAYEVEENAPGLFLFGSTGGGEAFAFDTRKDVWKIVTVPFVGMSLEDASDIAGNFVQFIDTLIHG